MSRTGFPRSRNEQHDANVAAIKAGLDAWASGTGSPTLIAGAFSGKPSGITRDDFLDNITLTWLTNTGISSGRLYWENKLGFFNAKGIKIPVAVTVFPDELYPAPRTWIEQAFPKLIHYNKVDKGGHLAAWEQPKTFSEAVRAGFRSLRG